MAGIPTNFQAISNVLPTYNFIDIASGTGFINFYAGTTVDLSLISNYTFYSEVVSSSAAVPFNVAKQLIIDKDFDVVLNRPLNIAGICTLNVPVNLYKTPATAYNDSCYIIAKIRKWDGVTETDICNNQSTTLTVSAGPGDLYKMFAIDLNIPLTHFKIGETLRLTIECWANYHTVGPGDTHTLYLGHDPKNRTDGWDATGAVPSQLILQLPVRLNL